MVAFWARVTTWIQQCCGLKAKTHIPVLHADTANTHMEYGSTVSPAAAINIKLQSTDLCVKTIGGLRQTFMSERCRVIGGHSSRIPNNM